MRNRGRWLDNRRGGGFRGSRGRGFGGPRGGGFGPPRGFNGPARGFRGGFRPQFRGSGSEDNPGKRLQEKEIGITEYISSHEGFSGVIKSRYSDFQVSEVSLEGEVAHLTQVSAPHPSTAKEVDENDEELELLSKYDTRLISLDTWDKLSALAAAPNSLEKVEVETEDMSKEGRTKIYDTVKSTFGGRLVGSTLTIGERKSIVFTRPQKGMRIDNREKWLWPEEYVHFLVYKENMDTMEAAGAIADALRMGHVKPTVFGYCGTKDRRAKTTQWFSLRKVDPRRILSSCRHLRNVSVGNFRFSATHLRLGDLRGNRFRIALRNVTATDEDISAAVLSLQQKGFLNYYGLQRFGSRAEIPTHRVGRCLLQGNFSAAVALLLCPDAAEPSVAPALRLYRTSGDAAAAIAALPPRAAGIEARLLQGLAHNAKTDLVTALERIPRNTRLLYIHSYQSWVWNRCVSERIHRWGLTPHVGDLVPLNPEELANTVEILEETLEDAEEEEPLQHSKDNSRKLGAKYPDINKKDIKVKILTEEDLPQYSIWDIVLPLPGYSIEYPPNMKEFYEDIIIKEDKLTLELKQTVKAYCLSGTYRKIVLKPENLTWKIVRYTDPYCDLILSDLDELQGKQIAGDVEDGKYRALLIDMTLPTSTYATMALRELLKHDTSSESQAKINNYHQENAAPVVDGAAEGSSITDEPTAEESSIVVDSVGKETSLILESVKKDSSLLEESPVVQKEINGEACLKMDTSDSAVELEHVKLVEPVTEKRKNEDAPSDDGKKAKLM